MVVSGVAFVVQQFAGLLAASTVLYPSNELIIVLPWKNRWGSNGWVSGYSGSGYNKNDHRQGSGRIRKSRH
jgi:hypothetical protein